jgi:hypothetical protein
MLPGLHREVSMPGIERLTAMHQHYIMHVTETETTRYFAFTHHLAPEDTDSEAKYEAFLEAERQTLQHFTESLPRDCTVGRIDRYESLNAQGKDFEHPGTTVTLRIAVVRKKAGSR